MARNESNGGPLRRLWNWFWAPAGRIALGLLVVVGFGGGVVFWGGFHWALELTNTETFCITCHQMRDNVYQELRQTVHFTNRSGVRATCPDCHVPKEWEHKIVRKIQASNELYHYVLGDVDTPEQFNAKRLQLASNEWVRMKRTDSRECRNCHKFEYMDYSKQEPRAARFHQEGLGGNKTCIDCHRGIAHKLPPNADETYRKVTAGITTEQGMFSRLLRGAVPKAEAAPRD